MGALRSREILDYENATLDDLRAESCVPVDLHLYFEKSGHLMVWRKAGEFYSSASLENYRGRGIHRVWIHKQDHAAFLEYLKGESSPPEILPEVSPAVSKDAGRIVAAVKANPQNKKIAASEGQAMLANLGKPSDAASQAEAIRQARRVIQDVMSQLSHEAGSVIQEIWRLAELDVNLQHSVNVATYSTIFALAFERIEEDLLGDVALAALVHDLGVSQIPLSVTTKSWKAQSPEEKQTYAQHVEATISLLAELQDDLGPKVALGRVRDIILQHHEKFDGSGYPRGIEGFRLDDIPQLVAMADILDSMSNGRWDGVSRSLHDTLEEIMRLEKAKTFPEFFNPEVFAAIVRWIQGHSNQKIETAAVQLVSKKTKELIRKVKY